MKMFRLVAAIAATLLSFSVAATAQAHGTDVPLGTVVVYCDNGITKTLVSGPDWPGSQPPFFADRGGPYVDWQQAPDGVTEGACAPTDTDGDGVADGDDAFPNDPNESVDSDGDGVGDNADGCDNEAGPASNGGCPVVDPGPKPDPIVTYGEWSGGEASCDTPEVTQVRSVTTIDFGPGYDGSTWVQLAPVETVETRVDTLTADEQAACQPDPTATVPPDNGGGNLKVFVCKYVGTPGVDERLQTGQNPISVSINAIPNYQGIGSYFADAQGRSYVLAEDTRTGGGQGGEPGIDQCPPPDTGETPTTVPSETPTTVPSETPTTVPSETPTATPDNGNQGQCPTGTTFLVKVEAGQTRIPVPGLIVSITGSTGTFRSTTPIGAVVVKSGAPGGMVDVILFDAALQGSFGTSGGDDISNVTFCSAQVEPTETPTAVPSETPVIQTPVTGETPTTTPSETPVPGKTPTTVPGETPTPGVVPPTETTKPTTGVTGLPDTGSGAGAGSGAAYLPFVLLALAGIALSGGVALRRRT